MNEAFLKFMHERSLALSEYPRFNLPIMSKESNKRRLERQELESRVIINKMLADFFHDHFNGMDKNPVRLFIAPGYPGQTEYEKDCVKEYLQKMTEYHVSERMKAEIALEKCKNDLTNKKN